MVRLKQDNQEETMKSSKADSRANSRLTSGTSKLLTTELLLDWVLMRNVESTTPAGSLDSNPSLVPHRSSRNREVEMALRLGQGDQNLRTHVGDGRSDSHCS